MMGCEGTKGTTVYQSTSVRGDKRLYRLPTVSIFVPVIRMCIFLNRIGFSDFEKKKLRRYILRRTDVALSYGNTEDFLYFIV